MRCSNNGGTAVTTSAPGGWSGFAVIASTAPAPGVRLVLAVGDGRAQQERPERVDHDGELIDLGDPDAAFVGAGLRAVDVAAGVQRHRTLADARAGTRRVVAAAVEHDLVAVDV